MKDLVSFLVVADLGSTSVASVDTAVAGQERQVVSGVAAAVEVALSASSVRL